MRYPSFFLSRQEIAEGTMAFVFQKPDDFTYRAGQNADYFLLNPPETDDKGNKRTFSFVSAPDEPHLTVATRMRDSAFKRVLKNAPIGMPLEIDGPYGDMTLHQDAAKPAVFLAGGIGITPFMSMIRHAAHAKLPHKIFLFYSNRRPEDAAFLSELQEGEEQNPNFDLIATMTEMEKSSKPWSGKTGYIDDAMVRAKIQDVTAPIYYLAGPGSMVKAMRGLLGKLGVSDDNIRTEEFTGY
ncbi:MAG: FAD-dependent oxidoreductase [Candidatus Kerfeldbacteria bacterium]|nr:FAD-dependent oxidoreductase [Candidatus Kerfeldbacteria bacterium]